MNKRSAYKRIVSKYGLQDKYLIDSKGHVVRERANGEYVEMKPFITKDGYVEYVLRKKSKEQQHVQCQILVIATFKGYPKDKAKTQVNHDDLDRTNNNISNLGWVTPAENVQHSYNNRKDDS